MSLQERWTPGAHRRTSALLAVAHSLLTPPQPRRARGLYPVPDRPPRHHPHRHPATARDQGPGHRRPRRLSRQSACRGDFVFRRLAGCCPLTPAVSSSMPRLSASARSRTGSSPSRKESIGLFSRAMVWLLSLCCAVADTTSRPCPPPKIHTGCPTGPGSPPSTPPHPEITPF
jgi:hypothetical protein